MPNSGIVRCHFLLLWLSFPIIPGVCSRYFPTRHFQGSEGCLLVMIRPYAAKRPWLLGSIVVAPSTVCLATACL